MSKPFLTPKEKEKILATYSKNFSREFDKMGPYTFGIPYIYILSLCPEIDREGKETGRILVNHYSYSKAWDLKAPEYIDVWERDGKELCFRTRNLPGRDIVSAEERVKVLEEELEAYRGLSRAEMSKLSTKKLREYARNITARYEQVNSEYNRVVTRIHSYREEADSYFRESPLYWELVKDRDDALLSNSEATKREKKLKEALAETTEKYLAAAKELETLSKSQEGPVHNARGAGRKKSPLVDEKKEKVLEMVKEGRSREEICQELGIGRSTYYRYLKESRD